VKGQLAKVCEISRILKYLQTFLLLFSESYILFPLDGPHGRNMQHPLTKVITFVVADGNTYVSIDVMPQQDEFHKNK